MLAPAHEKDIPQFEEVLERKMSFKTLFLEKKWFVDRWFIEQHLLLNSNVLLSTTSFFFEFPNFKTMFHFHKIVYRIIIGIIVKTAILMNLSSRQNSKVVEN